MAMWDKPKPLLVALRWRKIGLEKTRKNLDSIEECAPYKTK